MRIEVVASIVVLFGVVLAITLFALVATHGVPNVVACTEYDNPATSVEVRSSRVQGRIVERYALGCTWYFHEARSRASD